MSQHTEDEINESDDNEGVAEQDECCAYRLIIK